MKIIYIPVAAQEHDEKLDRIAHRPFTTHAVRDFLDDIAFLEQQILSHPGQRAVPGAGAGWFRVGPARSIPIRLFIVCAKEMPT
jgi:hypothetical protein